MLADASPRRALAWDAGCGNGQLSLSLAAHFERVIATEPSGAQLAQAQAHPRVEYRAEAAERSTLASASADLVVAAQAAHWFDLPRFYAEVRRVASGPDAVVALASYGLMHVTPAVDAVVQRFHDVTLEGLWPPERALVDAGYRTLPFPFTALELPAVEMVKAWSCAECLAYVHTWSAVQRLPAAGWAPFEASLRAAWGEAATRPVRWPLALRAGRVGEAQ